MFIGHAAVALAAKPLLPRVNRWVSSRQLGSGVDAMHLPLDRLVEANPKIAGWVILFFSLFAAVDFAIPLIRRL